MDDERVPLRDHLNQRISDNRELAELWQKAHDREHELLADAVREAKRVSTGTLALIGVLVGVATFLFANLPPVR